MKNTKKLENLKKELFSQEFHNNKIIQGGCCTIAGGYNTMEKNGTTTWDCPKESFTLKP